MNKDRLPLVLAAFRRPDRPMNHDVKLDSVFHRMEGCRPDESDRSDDDDQMYGHDTRYYYGV
jgi:hypothetical protein